MADLNNEKNTSLVIDGQSVDVINKPFSSSDTGLTIVLFFVGFLVSAVISGISITILV